MESQGVFHHVRGFARPVDYIIRVNVDIASLKERQPVSGPNQADEKAAYISTLNHELMHVFQFLGTAVGRDIARRDRFISSWQSRLLQYLGPDIQIPLAESLASRTDLAKRQEVQTILDRLATYYAEQAAQWLREAAHS